MALDQRKIAELVDSSREVLLNCCLANGAVIAANTDAPYYPKQANNYRYVWPRDAAFILIALEILGENNTEQFATWLLERAENFDTQGLIYRRYATNGAASHSYNELQPDQSGAIIWAFCQSSLFNQSENIKRAVEIIANDLTKTWTGSLFSHQTYDLWEHHHGEGHKGLFSYSLASCSYALQQAYEKHPSHNKSWQTTANSMKDLLGGNQDSYFALIKDSDKRLDASLLGLIWPFKVDDNHERLTKTLDNVMSELSNDNELKRFKGDHYDGEMTNGKDNNKGASTWPLLSFWACLAYLALGNEEQASQIFEDAITSLSDNFIPEQLLSGNRVGVKPLGWAHAMFIIATNSLFS